MSSFVVSAFRCERIDPTSSRMFTLGKVYNIVQRGIGLNCGYVEDDLGHLRYIPPSAQFIVENNSTFYVNDVRHAYFCPLGKELAAAFLTPSDVEP